MRKIRLCLLLLLAVVMILGGSMGIALRVSAGTVYESPYVSFSPDGKAFTTNAGDQNCQWYEAGTVVETGVTSSLRELQTGEHYYKVKREGEIPVGYWEVEHRTASCIHNMYLPEEISYHGLTFGRQKCFASYYSGWIAYCADCGEAITPILIYMSKEAATSITSLNTELDYYYLCPYCTNLEQGSDLGTHYCQDISDNRYQVRYDANTTDPVSGYMEPSIHMYNNAEMFEGVAVTPQTRLSKNTYARTGYCFVGWNTEPDGSGTNFADQAEILNLTTKNYDESGEGTVTLYAQWRRAVSTLLIDPAEGTYLGSTNIFSKEGDYGSFYTIDLTKLVSPAGYTVKFDTQGGDPVAAMTSTTSFAEWILTQPFRGRFRDQTYYYTAEAGAIDQITAVYEQNPISLPGATKQGSSFAGWYYDPNFTSFAGTEGDMLLPGENITLYAKWVDLLLVAENNYTVNKGKGAVNLSWEQNDGNSKVYLLYQSQDALNWQLISDAEDIGSNRSVSRTFSYSGRTQTYTVRYTGIYLLTLNGAQGANYGSYKGGYGGQVSARVWLEAGEKLTITLGGQSGYSGGGAGSDYGNGGGCSVVTSSRQGVLLVAGGGGGATDATAGGSGGSLASVLPTGYNGQDGDAGGGGGYYGGTAASIVRHVHTEDCTRTEVVDDTVINSVTGKINSWASAYRKLDYLYYTSGSYFAETVNLYTLRSHGFGESALHMEIGAYKENGETKYTYIPTNGAQTLAIHIQADSWGQGQMSSASLIVYNQNGKVILKKTLGSVTKLNSKDVLNDNEEKSFLTSFETATGGILGNVSGWYCYYASDVYLMKSGIYWNETITLPENTTGIRISVVTDFGNNEAWTTMNISDISLEGTTTTLICGKAEGALEECTPAYGGSNYVNTASVLNYSQKAGVNTGNGSLQIQSVQTGFQETLSLTGVTAPDLAAPDQIEESTVTKQAGANGNLLVSWEEPADNGTVYYHRAESYLAGETDILSNSNVTQNTLTSGVAGYYYVLDKIPATKVTNVATLSKKASLEVELADQVQYLHVAAVDVAGNLGPTTHIEIGGRNEEIAWPVWTDQILIDEDNEAVYAAGAAHTYYVRSDGNTSFQLTFSGFLTEAARTEYQVNHLYFAMSVTGQTESVLDILTPFSDRITGGLLTFTASDLTVTATKETPLKDGSYLVTKRADYCKKLTVYKGFVSPLSMDGKKIQITPGAGVETQEQLVHSDVENDKNHSIWLIGDGKAPTIQGIEELEKLMEQEPVDGVRSVVLTAEDAGSGVRDFYGIITNSDNGSRQTFQGEYGVLTITAREEDVLFQGDFHIEIHAVDNVGNENVETGKNESFYLAASVERILQPHQPIFRCGESGRLSFTVYGYADSVEVIFPEAFTALDPGLNTVFSYGKSALIQQETIDFMVPLTITSGTWQIMVIAYKDGKVLTQTPYLWTLGEGFSVLDDFRTRLR